LTTPREPPTLPGMRRLLTLLVAGLLACATNPVTGRQEIVLMSPEREASVGKQAAAEVAQTMGLVDDPDLVAFVRQVGARVAAHSPRKDVPFQFAIANMAETNAFALPGGYVYVSRGLLALARSEDELANVLAHEVGHVAARHAAQRETRALGVGLLSLLGTVGAGLLGGDAAAGVASQLGQAAGAGLIASYSRDQERQADEVGQQMSRTAGYDPAGMTNFLDALDREVTLRLGKPRRPTFLDSHPVTSERVKLASARAQQLGSRGGLPPLSKRGAFVARLEGLLVDEDPAEGVVRDQLFLHPDLDLHVVFPDGWTVQNAREAVGAQAPDGAALIVLTVQEQGSDPRAAAEKFVRANAQALEVLEDGAFSGAGAPAYRVRARVALQQGTAGAELFWLAHRGAVYRLQCLAGAQAFSSFVPEFTRTAKSFRSLNGDERASIRERRLHVVRASGGETLAALAQRSGNVWRVEQVALANGVEANARLAAGDRIKLAVERPYRGRR
jgi:predicted Zn-dependent protease